MRVRTAGPAGGLRIESRQVSIQYLDLVMNLTPPGRRYHVESPSASRERTVLIVLAYLADDDGVCTASLNDLAAYTQLQPPTIRTALKDLKADHGFVEIVRKASAPNLYRLKREVLEARSYHNMLRNGQPTVELLTCYGLDIRSIHALHRGALTTLAELGAKIEEYRRTKVDRDLPFYRFLDIRGLGERSAQKVLACYDLWQTEGTAPTEREEENSSGVILLPQLGDVPPSAVARQPESPDHALR